MDFKTMTIEDIMAWCQANNQVAWLKEIANKQVPCKVYPRIKKDGKSVVDKSQEPTIQMRKITFIQIKTEFVNKFMPDLAPKAKAKKKSMYDLIAEL